MCHACEFARPLLFILQLTRFDSLRGHVDLARPWGAIWTRYSRYLICLELLACAMGSFLLFCFCFSRGAYYCFCYYCYNSWFPPGSRRKELYGVCAAGYRCTVCTVSCAWSLPVRVFAWYFSRSLCKGRNASSCEKDEEKQSDLLLTGREI